MSKVNGLAPMGRKERVAVQRRQIDEFYDSVKRLRQKSRLDYNERRIHEFERFVMVVIYRIFFLHKPTSNFTHSCIRNLLEHSGSCRQTVFCQELVGQPTGAVPSTTNQTHLFTQSASPFCSKCRCYLSFDLLITSPVT